MILQTLSDHGQIALPGGNSTASSLQKPSTSLIAPNTIAASSGVTNVGDGVIAGGDGGSVCPNGVNIWPYGVGTATNTFKMHIYGWNRTIIENTKPLWYPFKIAAFTCTLCTLTGLADSPLGTTQKFCDTIVILFGNANISNEILSPTGNEIATITMDLKGARFYEFRFDMNSSATSANALIAKM